MALTFAFIGNRADLGYLLPLSQKEALSITASPDRSLAWGVGFFQTDEVLLRRRPSETRSPLSLAEEWGELRCHALLGHVCQTKSGALRTETTPPLRFGHLLFACQGTSPHLEALRPSVSDALPDFLRSHLKGDTFTELAGSIFLAELPRPQLERTWSRHSRPPLGTLAPDAIREALRRTFTRLDEFAAKIDVDAFSGGLWVNTGEHLIVAHRRGPLGLGLYRGRRELETLLEPNEPPPPSLDLSHFTALMGGKEPLPPGWERLPDGVIVTASRTQAPETEALT